MASIALGVDVGGTFAKIAAVSPDGKILRLDEMPTDAGDGAKPFVGRLLRLLQIWRKQGIRPSALGLGLAGDVDHEHGCLRLTPNLPGWQGFCFRDAFKRALRLPAVVENDANAAVWGAYATELKRRPRHVIGVTLGTGVGGGLIVDGRLHRGATGTAGEIGHARVAMSGARCHCGARGCLEAYAGKYGIVRTARELLRARPDSGAVLRRLVPNLKALSPKCLKAAADQGDPIAREVWRRTGTVLGWGLANVVIVFNPDVLVFLGGVSRAGNWILDPVRRVFHEHPFGTSLRHVTLRCAVNPNGGCVGAALLALEDRSGR
ncbi:MAG TPA: hypothetical protein DEB40_02955 [Elusimicrobia bacterium]|nr:hypothetical protein [Elusimicrobiota bacterium]HBT60690.1 hypothetical protein [Elusimicrobiota bacterium]